MKPVSTVNEMEHVAAPPASKLEAPTQISENGLEVLRRRYLRKGPDGKPMETVPEMFWRVASNVALPERAHGGEEAYQSTAEEFYDLLNTLRFFPNSPTFTGAGTPLGQLAACFVLAIDDDMGKDSSEGIFNTLRNAALIQQTGGGNGFSFSRLRPRGGSVNSSAGVASGPVGFLKVYDAAFGEIAQGGCLTSDSLVFTSNGLLRLDELVDQTRSGWQEHSLSVPTDDGDRTSPRGFNNGVQPVMSVQTREGLSLTGTLNHKVKVMTDEGPAWRRLDELKPGDAILVMLGQHQGRLRALRRPIKTHGNQADIGLPSILDETLAFVLGYLAGDGFVAAEPQDHRIGFSVAHDNYLLDELPVLLQQVFPGCKVHRQQKADDASVTYVVDSAILKQFMVDNGFAKPKSHEVSVPRLVRQSPANVAGAYLRGLFEADGGLSHGYPQLNTTSQRLAQEVATLLIGLGCPVTIRSADYSGRLGKRPQWIVRITSHIGLEAWRQRIGCDRRSRFVGCYTFRPDVERESSYPLPHAVYWLQPVLDEVTLPQIDRQGRGQSINWRATDPQLRRKLLRYLRDERQLTMSAYRELSAASPEFAQHARPVANLWFVHVAETCLVGEQLTLDLEVDGNHTYLANGLVTHNTRRGANMGVLRVDHPDIEEFIACKAKEGQIANFNISVGVTDAFMEAVKADTEYDLINPHTKKVTRSVRARDIFDKISHYAHRNGEPGVLFLDAANRSNPVPHLYELEATNPCGEQFLGPYENCCLGSINLAQHVTDDGKIDWAKLEKTVVESTHFLDDVVSANKYVPAVPQLQDAAHRVRRIGLGIMGLADVMYRVGVRYGDQESLDLAGQVMEFVRYHCMRTSIDLARERGPFLAIEGSIYDPNNLKWQPPTPLQPYTHEFGRPAVDWDAIIEGIKAHGIRNGAQTTVAPTGTIGTVTSCEGYGCEPVFALAYTRYVKEAGGDVTLTYVSPLFIEALDRAGITGESRERIVDQIVLSGTCQGVDELPQTLQHTFVVSQDITAAQHVLMQAALQCYVDNSISKTINCPPEATPGDIKQVYMQAWELGCKGLTVYVTGSRQEVVLETKATADAKKAGTAEQVANGHASVEETLVALPYEGDSPLVNGNGHRAGAAPEYQSYDIKRPRPKRLHGATYRRLTPLGTAYVTVNDTEEGEPFEVFMNVGKAGSDVAAVSEALGRLISLALRMPSSLSPTERLQQVVYQLNGIGGGRHLGFGPQRVRSLPDAIAQVLAEHLEEVPAPAPHLEPPAEQLALPIPKQIGDLCPDCGNSTLLNIEGCRKCHVCGYSEC